MYSRTDFCGPSHAAVGPFVTTGMKRGFTEQDLELERGNNRPRESRFPEDYKYFFLIADSTDYSPLLEYDHLK
jgi:hypothetical protein